jgi:uncharacterized protein
MRWENEERSSNVEDRRGMGMPARMKGGGIGIILLALVGMYFGIDPSIIMNMGDSVQQVHVGPSGPVHQSVEEQQQAEFVSVVLAQTEETWHQIFSASGKSYQEPKLVLFSGAVQSACGYAQAAMGPFYCPRDQKVYIDLSFFQELKRKLNAPGDFAQAYVIAHEIGHHVQQLLGISDRVQARRQRISSTEYNKLSVMLELQADCLAGVWANRTDKVKKLVEPGDIEEAMNAASQIGDDRLQKQHQGYVVPDSFTHGSSAQRVRWFRSGYESGKINNCNTFNATNL